MSAGHRHASTLRCFPSSLCYSSCYKYRENAGLGEYALLELSRDNVGEDLKLAMTVSAKTGARVDAIFVDHTKGTELRVNIVIVPIAQSGSVAAAAKL